MTLRKFFSPFMKPLEKDYLYLFMLIFISLSSGITSLFYKDIIIIILAIIISSMLSIVVYCLIKNIKKEKDWICPYGIYIRPCSFLHEVNRIHINKKHIYIRFNYCI